MEHNNEQTALVYTTGTDISEFLAFVDNQDNDTIFEELQPHEEQSKRQIIKRSACSIFTMTILCGIFIAIFSIALIYFNLNFNSLCDSTKWQELPQPVKVVHIYSHCFCDQLFMFWYAIDLSFVFSVRRDLRTILVLTNLLAGCFTTIYRLTTKITNIYATSSWLGTPQYIVFLATVFFTSWKVLPPNNYTIWRKIKYIVLVNIQVILAFLMYALNLYVIVPSFVRMTFYARLVIATVIPIFGYIARIICRQTLLQLRLFHPGNLYILVAGLYALTILYYRIFQSNIDTLLAFMYLGFVHAFFGCIERLSVLYQKPIIGYVLSKLRYNGYQVERTPKEKRVASDMLVMGIIYEVWGSLAANILLFMYEIQHSIPKEKGSSYSTEKAITDLMIRILYSMTIDYIFILLSVYIIVRKGNLPINRIWKKKWRRIAVVLTINALFPILAASKVIIMLTEKSYFDQLSDRGDLELASRLKMCNYTSYPFK